MGLDQDRRRRAYPLRFREFGGLVIQVRKPGWSAFEKLTRAVLVLGDDLDGPNRSTIERMPAWRLLFEAFAESLISWDLTDRGRPVPATKTGVLAQDFALLIALARTWYVVVVQHDETAEAERAADDIRKEDRPQADPQAVDNPAGYVDDGSAPEIDEEWLAQLPAQPFLEPQPDAEPTAAVA